MTDSRLPVPRTSADQLGQTRRDVEKLVCGMPGGNPDQRGFEHPWEIRAFAMAVAAHQTLKFDWANFQKSLIASIQAWESTNAGAADGQWSYYQHWVSALEAILTDVELLNQDDLDLQTDKVLALPPNRNHHEAHTEPITIDPARTVAT
ncbi:nitrile hydratase accessory protein [Paenarthrobacter nitroguajacolicus]|uniref:nitrile hydratase accessory protein n=1 Tax=Paenarthrobacter nitroguajacolicus TaxID=211146 RepID=UPI00248D37B4|nr:nitrile hydratase accessory protein [Paenarthrobacter nitroguajacolicus]MDI2037250.1 hypothetical protein [Paenarthrobacter nitroguajacolicus]